MLDMKKVGIKICAFRKKIGYSQEKLSEMLCISPQAISKWENGHTLPETSLLPVLAQIFDCTIDDIIMPAYTFDEKIEAEKPDTLEKQAENIAQMVIKQIGENVVSKEEKEECIPVIERIVELAQKVRREGLLSLEVEIPEEQNFFLQKGLQLAVDSIEPETIERLLQGMILADNRKGSELLSRKIIIQGIINIVNGNNPKAIYEILLSMLGEEYLLNSEQYLTSQNTVQKQLEFLQSIADMKAAPECEEFEAFILALNRRSLQILLRHVNSSGLVIALYGCSRALAEQFSWCMSLTVFKQFINVWETMLGPPPTKYILENQQHIMKLARELEKRGEIII